MLKVSSTSLISSGLTSQDKRKCWFKKRQKRKRMVKICAQRSFVHTGERRMYAGHR